MTCKETSLDDQIKSYSTFLCYSWLSFSVFDERKIVTLKDIEYVQYDGIILYFSHCHLPLVSTEDRNDPAVMKNSIYTVKDQCGKTNYNCKYP